MDVFRELISKERSSKKGNGIENKVRTSPLSIPEGIFPTLKEGVDYLVAEAIRRTKGNQSLAADLLGITPSALNKRLHRSASEKKYLFRNRQRRTFSNSDAERTVCIFMGNLINLRHDYYF